MKRWLHHFDDFWRLGEQAPPAQPAANFKVISFSLGFAINRRVFGANHSDLLECVESIKTRLYISTFTVNTKNYELGL
jgi:hypothetical protein